MTYIVTCCNQTTSLLYDKINTSLLPRGKPSVLAHPEITSREWLSLKSKDLFRVTVFPPCKNSLYLWYLRLAILNWILMLCDQIARPFRWSVIVPCSCYLRQYWSLFWKFYNEKFLTKITDNVNKLFLLPCVWFRMSCSKEVNIHI